MNLKSETKAGGFLKTIWYLEPFFCIMGNEVEVWIKKLK